MWSFKNLWNIAFSFISILSSWTPLPENYGHFFLNQFLSFRGPGLTASFVLRRQSLSVLEIKTGPSGQAINLLVQTSNQTDNLNPQTLSWPLPLFHSPDCRLWTGDRSVDWRDHNFQHKEALDLYSLYHFSNWRVILAQSKTTYATLVQSLTVKNWFLPKKIKIQYAKVFICTGWCLTTTTCS